MKTPSLKATRQHLILLVGSLAILAGAGGCLLPGEGSTTLTFRPDGRHADYEYTFSEAYAAPSSDGGYDLVVLAGYDPRSATEGLRVQPVEVRPVTQVIRLHIAWRPSRGAKNDYPAATNATLQWHIFHNQPGKPPAHLAYTGAGFATVETSEETSLFGFRDIRVWPESATGEIKDPIGPSAVFGQIRAKNDAPLVKEVLARLEADLTAVPAPTPATRPAGTEPANTPPPRNMQP